MIRKIFRKVLNSSRAPKEGAVELDEDAKEAVMGHRIQGSREKYFDRHYIKEIIEKMKNCDFDRLSETDLIVEERLNELLKERDEEIRRLKQQIERGPELDKLIKDKKDVIKLVKILEEYGSE